MRRQAASAAVLALGVLALLVAGCRSPNRGVWAGTFDGSVSGVVEFRISASGRDLEGTMDGRTRDGQPFKAEMEGKMRDAFFYASFEGTSDAGLYPVRFEGFMKGELRDGGGGGEWDCELWGMQGSKLRGTWSVTQQDPE